MRISSAKLAALALSASVFTVPAFAQTQTPASPSGTPPAIASPNGNSIDKSATAPSATPTAKKPADAMKQDETMNNSTAAVPADVAMTGKRASKLIGMAVVNDKDESIGKVDDILIGPDDKATAAVISVGGFLGIGSKWVAVPFDQLKPAPNDSKSLTMPNASKESLKSMPAFDYGNGA